MPEATDEKMNVDERYKVLRSLHFKYEKAKRSERSVILDHVVTITGLSRKHVITLLNKPGPLRKRRTRQRSRTYGAEVEDAIRLIARTLDWCCAERLQPALVTTALLLSHFGALRLSKSLLGKLESISISSVERILQRIRQHEPRLPQRRGRPAPLTSIQREIPARVIPWDEPVPGHFEVDTVHHSGPTAKGDYVCTIQWIDVATGWSERMAIYGRSERETVQAFERILQRCPIPVLELHPDNGSEFMNAHLMRYFKEHVKGVQWTRSRPFHKNDNRFVEQKNATLVRAYFKDARFEHRAQAAMLNELYELMGIYYNLFQPVLRQATKRYIVDETGIVRCQRTHDRAQTPFQRLVASNAAPTSILNHWQTIYDTTNPLTLKNQIDTLWYALLETTR